LRGALRHWGEGGAVHPGRLALLGNDGCSRPVSEPSKQPLSRGWMTQNPGWAAGAKAAVGELLSATPLWWASTGGVMVGAMVLRRCGGQGYRRCERRPRPATPLRFALTLDRFYPPAWRPLLQDKTVQGAIHGEIKLVRSAHNQKDSNNNRPRSVGLMRVAITSWPRANCASNPARISCRLSSGNVATRRRWTLQLRHSTKVPCST